jgi:tRNA pseudouridine55 synthase
VARSDGYVLIDKPSGPTSHDVVAAVRRTLHLRRVGHTGTLDPFATGLLVVLTGRATRLSRFLVGLTKTYTGTIRLGVRTDTDDRTGRVLEPTGAGAWPTPADVDAVASAMVGKHEQRPPQYSAKKVGGRRAFAEARRGAAVDLAPVEVEVFGFDIVAFEGERVQFTADVSSGTYIRALARDLGDRLGCGAHLEELRRTRVGDFPLADASTLEAFADEPLVFPSLGAVPHLAHHHLSPTERDLIAHGRPIPAPSEAPPLMALVSDGELTGVAETAAGQLKPRVVLTDA